MWRPNKPSDGVTVIKAGKVYRVPKGHRMSLQYTRSNTTYEANVVAEAMQRDTWGGQVHTPLSVYLDALSGRTR